MLVAAGITALGYRRIAGAPVGLVLDDGLFYARIAMNLVTTGQPTFDGIHTTSGFHLLWEGILASLSWTLVGWSADPHHHMAAFLTLSLFLVLALSSEFADRPHHRLALATLALSGHLLLETGLLVLLLLGMTRTLERIASGDGRRVDRAVLFACAALIPLTRIDALPVVLVLLAAPAVAGRWRVVGLGLVAAAAGTATQLGVMFALFGEPWSVSSMLRGHALVRHGASPLWFNFFTYGAGLSARSLLVTGMGSAAIALAWLHRDRARNLPLLWLGVGLATFTAGHLLLSHMRYWYFVPGLVGFGYVLARLDLPVGTSRGIRALVLVGLALLSVLYLGNKARRMVALADAQDATWSFLEEIGEHVPAGEAIYQEDGSGRTGVYSGRAVVNGDGLVNDYRYARRLMGGDLAGYLDEEGICYLIVNRASHPAPGEPLVDQGGLVVLPDQVVELTRSGAHGRTGQVNYTLYRRLDPDCRARAGVPEVP